MNVLSVIMIFCRDVQYYRGVLCLPWRGVSVTHGNGAGGLRQDSCVTQLHCNGNSVYIFLFWELSGLGPNFHIHVSVSDLYIPRIGSHISLQQTDPRKI